MSRPEHPGEKPMRTESDKLRDAISDIIEETLGVPVDSYDAADRLIELFELRARKGGSDET